MQEGHRQIFQRLREEDPLNKVCIDCNTANPQWVSASFGCYFCLDCSGQHRGLGSHISFVRSVTMDAFKEMELKKMIAGGNTKLKIFFEKYGVAMNLPIRQKYDNEVAAIYREKLKAEAEGREYTIPKDISFKPSPSPALRQVYQSNQPKKQTTSWEDEWDEPESNYEQKSNQYQQKSFTNTSTNQYKQKSFTNSSTNQYQQKSFTNSPTNQYQQKSFTNSSTNQYQQKSFTNSPTNQKSFSNQKRKQEEEDELLKKLESGWGFISNIASATVSGAKTLGEKTIELGSNAKESLGNQLGEDWNSEEVKKNVFEKTTTGWNMFTGYLSKAKEYTTEYVNYATEQLNQQNQDQQNQEGYQNQYQEKRTNPPKYSMPVPQSTPISKNSSLSPQIRNQISFENGNGNNSPSLKKTEKAKTDEEEYNDWLDNDDSGWEVSNDKSKNSLKNSESSLKKKNSQKEKDDFFDNWD